MFPGINYFYYCILIHIAGLNRKLVKIGGSSEPLEPPPGYGPGLPIQNVGRIAIYS